MLQAETDMLLCRLGIMHWKHMPSFVSVEPAGFCQLRCPECPVGQAAAAGSAAKRQFMDFALFSRILHELAPYVHTMQFYFQGEPLLNTQLPRMLQAAHDKGIYTVVSTNAQLLTQETALALLGAGLDRIIVSVDGLTEEAYSAYRQGGSLQKALNGLRFLREAKTQLKAHTCIELQCLRLKTNEHQWADFRRNYKQLGADRLTLKTAQLYDYQHGNPLMPTNPRYSRYVRGSDGLYHLRHTGRGLCRRLLSGCVIDSAGNVLPCCFDKAREHPFGNMDKQTFAECWLSPQAFAFRRKVLENRQDVHICNNCTE